MKTQKKQSNLSCTHRTAFLFFLFIGSAFVFISCTQLYKIIGLTPDQTADQVAADQAVKKQIIEQIRFTTTELITTAIAGVGAIASGFLAKWLGTERKITKVLITAIESDNDNTVKATAHRSALDAGVESQLNTRVRALT